MNTSKVSRLEVINHTKDSKQNNGRVYVYWDTTEKSDIQLSLQDEGRTLKVFINDK